MRVIHMCTRERAGVMSKSLSIFVGSPAHKVPYSLCLVGSIPPFYICLVL